MTAGAITLPAPTRARPHRRALALVVVLAVVLVAGGLAAAGATVHHRQQDALTSARLARSSADTALTAALTAAAGDGVSDSLLAPVRYQQATILQEAARSQRLGYFDGGEIDHLRSQADRLRGVLSEVPAIEEQATGAARASAAAALDHVDALVATADAAGAATAAPIAELAAARGQLAVASTPLQALAVLSAAPLLDAEVRTAITRHHDDVVRALAEELAAATADADAALGRADRLLAQAQAIPVLQLGTDPADIAAAHAKRAAASTADDFRAVTAAATPPANDLGSLLNARSAAYGAMADARALVADAQKLTLDASATSAALDAIQPRLDAAGTRDALNGARSDVLAAEGPLQVAIAKATVGLGKVIVVSLADQSMTAYENGVPFVQSLVTTGRPALPTPPGAYTVLRKNSPWHMVSEYPPGTQGYYPPSWVTWVLWFRDDGYGIHDAPWRSTYGPGTQQYGSHGCINVPHDAMASLYGWADVGTRVLVI